MEFEIFVSYSQLLIFDHSLKLPFNDWNEAHVNQGFSWRPGSVAFGTIAEGGEHVITISIASIDSPPDSEPIRVIDVPFQVPEGGIVEVGSISDSHLIELEPGLYRLRFNGYEVPAEEQVTAEGARICLEFFKTENPEFKILRADSELAPGEQLLLTAEPA